MPKIWAVWRGHSTGMSLIGPYELNEWFHVRITPGMCQLSTSVNAHPHLHVVFKHHTVQRVRILSCVLMVSVLAAATLYTIYCGGLARGLIVLHA